MYTFQCSKRITIFFFIKGSMESIQYDRNGKTLSCQLTKQEIHIPVSLHDIKYHSAKYIKTIQIVLILISTDEYL